MRSSVSSSVDTVPASVYQESNAEFIHWSERATTWPFYLLKPQEKKDRACGAKQSCDED